MSFYETDQFKSVSIKSIRALKAHSAKSDFSDASLYLIVNTEKPLTDKKDYIQRVIPIPNKFRDFDSQRILIITKNNTNLNNYVEVLKPLTEKYENIELISLKRLKRVFGSNPKKITKLYHDYDLLICDYRVQHLLPDVLGAIIFSKHKKIPYIIKLNQQDQVPEAGKTKKEIKEVVDPKYVRQQLKSIVSNTSFILSTDLNISIKINEFTTENSTKQIYENIQAIVEFITDKNNRPITNINFKKNGLKSLLIKTNESASLPLYTK